ncbi:transcriptional regulator BetI [Pseudomonas sp. CAN2814]|uniref:transcriptional regulator BetI n=1 Tax=Pseudomonas sp. CAN1 TaxID=3046726 RepID=UPI002647585F|nr:transcriptional regulator BetI [Pseudomonas sp. CAN1]MDN6859395.1 transcriptional regulator BetI [Pseudomonas sp. CAN1]
MSVDSPGDKPRKRRTRVDAETRRKAIVEATMRCITRFGHAGTTIERICDEAEVSVGLIGHHFSSKDELMLATYMELTIQLREETRRYLETKGSTPLERLTAIIRSSFRGSIFNEFILTTWLGFWGAAVSSEQLRELNRKLYADYRKELEAVFKAIAAERELALDAKGSALIITALIDGFWLEWALDHKAFSARKAEKCCLQTAQLLTGVVPT